ncbi:hypothetical protein IWW50_000300 [Coemansia erecta]|nr:hypothetical protein GGF43_000529 [Coemansia sp. RSA 2618]KAJ2830411.1 hypothetical protein IWW50_000300 [Coemansia erecta]
MLDKERSASCGLANACPQASGIAGVAEDDPLQRGVELAMQAVWLFLDSDFEKIEQLLHRKRHSLLYASEGYAAIQYLRAMMTFTQEAMSAAQQAAEGTIHLAQHFRKPRGVTSMLSASSSRASSPASGRHRHANHGQDGAASDTSASEGSKARGWFRMDSPRLILREKKAKNGHVADDAVSVASVSDMAGEDKPDLDLAMLDAKYSELQDSDSTPAPVFDDSDEGEPALDRPQQRSWASGIATMADSVIGAVRTGTQAIGISRPEWHALKSMTAVQRHAELVHAEAYLLRAMLNIAVGDGMLALLKEGWHVRSAYATYRNCYAYIQDAHASGERVDDHFVSGTYLGMGVFNLVLSMMPARLLRFIELVGFTADRSLGLELLAVAAGWRADPETAKLMGAAPAEARTGGKAKAGGIHPCGYGLRSEFCAIVLQGYHVFLCNDLYLGYPNFPLVEVVLQRSLQQHPSGLIYIYFEGRFLMTRTRMREAIERFGELVRMGRGAVESMHLRGTTRAAGTEDEGKLPSRSVGSEEEAESGLISELAAMTTSEADEDQPPPLPTRPGVVGESTSSVSEWRQLQYLGHWERSLCLMSLGRWLDAAEGFNLLRNENNWNKAVYTYSLACCMWEHYLTLCGGNAPARTTQLTDEQRRVLDIVRGLMELVPTLKRKVAGKSIPIEKFVIRKSKKFHQQECFLMRPGLELLHAWNLYSKMPHERLLVLRDEVEREIAHLTHFAPISRAPEHPYRHLYYYDDLAVLLLTKGAVLRELSYPSFVATLASSGYSGSPTPSGSDASSKSKASEAPPPSGTPPSDAEYASLPDLGPIACDTFLRLLRLMPLIERDHYLAVIARFGLGNLYLAEHSTLDTQWVDMARAQWKCVLGGKPLSSPPYLSQAEYQTSIERVSKLLDNDAQADTASKDLLAAPGCLAEERILQDTGHPSLSFYDGTWQLAEWRYMPIDWADSRKYSLENMLEVRVFNANNRLQEKLDA